LFEKRDPAAGTFDRELQPISEEFDTAALEVSDLDLGLLMQSGVEPASAMTEAAAWIEHPAGRDRPVAVAFASRPHTHNALDDAVEQAEIFQHLWTWHR
jgi:hypothetical protein